MAQGPSQFKQHMCIRYGHGEIVRRVHVHQWLQIFEGVGATYKGFFEPGPEGPAVPDLIPCNRSFKILAETPLQVTCPLQPGIRSSLEMRSVAPCWAEMISV